jgi:hypothetical protein
MSIQQFFDILNNNHCRYVLLRWFDDLMENEPMGDLDILVHDEDTEMIGRLLIRSSRYGSIPCDLCTVSGMSNTVSNMNDRYPKPMAEQILSRSVMHQTGAYVPCLEDYFYSLAFHAIYHKGYNAGIPISELEPNLLRHPHHNYYVILSDLAAELCLDIDINMTSLDRMFREKGWSPDSEMLEVFSHNNEWCKKIYTGRAASPKA